MNYCNVALLIFFTTFTNCATSLNVRFDSSAYNAFEGDVLLQPGLVLSESSSTAITVQVIADDITATGEYTDIIINSVALLYNITGGGVDYNSGPYNVAFPAGVTRASFSITINNDDVLEDHETFNLIIAEDSLPENVTLGIPYLTEVTIFNIGGSSKYAIDNCVIIYVATNVGKAHYWSRCLLTYVYIHMYLNILF